LDLKLIPVCKRANDAFYTSQFMVTNLKNGWSNRGICKAVAEGEGGHIFPQSLGAASKLQAPDDTKEGPNSRPTKYYAPPYEI
jgi:hypothetical protein